MLAACKFSLKELGSCGLNAMLEVSDRLKNFQQPAEALLERLDTRRVELQSVKP